VVESWVAQIVSPELGDAYLGTQGDIWDAQKDMTLAIVGALITVGLTYVMSKSRKLPEANIP
jgi:putative membrane protein